MSLLLHPLEIFAISLQIIERILSNILILNFFSLSLLLLLLFLKDFVRWHINSVNLNAYERNMNLIDTIRDLFPTIMWIALYLYRYCDASYR